MRLLLTLLLATLTTPTQAETITPTRNQSPAQLQTDQRACADLARQRTGFNPDTPAPSLTTDATKGAATGLLSGDPTKSAAAGAASAAMRHRTQSAEHREKQAAYDKTRITCLTDRGYTVK